MLLLPINIQIEVFWVVTPCSDMHCCYTSSKTGRPQFHRRGNLKLRTLNMPEVLDRTPFSGRSVH